MISEIFPSSRNFRPTTVFSEPSSLNCVSFEIRPSANSRTLYFFNVSREAPRYSVTETGEPLNSGEVANVFFETETVFCGKTSAPPKIKKDANAKQKKRDDFILILKYVIFFYYTNTKTRFQDTKKSAEPDWRLEPALLKTIFN